MKRALTALAALLLAAPAAADAADPGLWVGTGRQVAPNYYRQGLASDPATGDVFFSGAFAGIYRTRGGRQLASNTNPIPQDVRDREQYNHIGDIAFDRAEGGRILLPLESYVPFRQDTNPSKTGSIGVMDAKTLRWKYYVKLDPAEIAKAQWLATDAPDGLVWTITGHDLLAYRLSDVNPQEAASNAAPLHSVRRLTGVAPTGAGGAVVFRGRIYLSTQVGTVDEITSVDPSTGSTRVEVELPGTMEPEGLDVGSYLNGLLHWELVPGGGLTSTQIVDLVPKGARLRLQLSHSRVHAGRKVALAGVVRVLTSGFAIALENAQLRIAGKRARTDASGFARLVVQLTRGLYRAEGYFPGLRTTTKRFRAT